MVASKKRKSIAELLQSGRLAREDASTALETIEQLESEVSDFEKHARRETILSVATEQMRRLDGELFKLKQELNELQTTGEQARKDSESMRRHIQSKREEIRLGKLELESELQEEKQRADRILQDLHAKAISADQLLSEHQERISRCSTLSGEQVAQLEHDVRTCQQELGGLAEIQSDLSANLQSCDSNRFQISKKREERVKELQEKSDACGYALQQLEQELGILGDQFENASAQLNAFQMRGVDVSAINAEYEQLVNRLAHSQTHMTPVLTMLAEFQRVLDERRPDSFDVLWSRVKSVRTHLNSLLLYDQDASSPDNVQYYLQ